MLIGQLAPLPILKGFESIIAIANNFLNKHAPLKRQSKKHEKLQLKPWVIKDI